MRTRTLRSTFAASILATITFVFAVCGLATAAEPVTISIAALQGSFSSFNVPNGQGGTLPTGTWYVQQTGPGSWNFDPSTGRDTFAVPLQASFPGLPGSPSTQVNFSETGIFQFAQDEEGNIGAQGANVAVVHATIPGVPEVVLTAYPGNGNWWFSSCRPKDSSYTIALQPFPTGFTGFPPGTLPPNGRLPAFGTDGLYAISGFLQVSGVPGAQQFTGTGSFDTAPLSSGSMTAANEFVSLASGSVSQIDLAVGYVSGTNSFYVDISTDNGGLPGAVLASFTGLSSSTTFGQCCGLVTISGISGLSLTAGTPYWIVIGPTTLDSTTSEEWNLNSQGVAGPDLFSTDGGATWTSRGQQTLGAFDILAGSNMLFSDLGSGENLYQCCFGLQVSGSGAGTDKSLVSTRTK